MSITIKRVAEPTALSKVDWYKKKNAKFSRLEVVVIKIDEFQGKAEYSDKVFRSCRMLSRNGEHMLVSYTLASEECEMEKMGYYTIRGKVLDHKVMNGIRITKVKIMGVSLLDMGV